MAGPLQSTGAPPPVSLPAAPAASANTYSDINGLAALKADSRSPAALHAVAQQVDAMFLQMMLKSMREASADVGEPESNEMGMYQDMFDKQISLSMAQHQGLGLGSLFARQSGASEAGSTAAPALPQGGAARGVAADARANTDGTAAGAHHGSAAGAGTPPSPSDFVSAVLPAIRVAAAGLGVSPLGMLAQAALETGWGQRTPRTADGGSSLNLFGIKAGDSWAGARATAPTLEYSGGIAQLKHTAFRVYGSIEQSVSDFANLLGSSPRYREAIVAGGNVQAYINGIGKSGYATDPDYAAKLNKMLHSNTFRQALADSGTKI